MILESGNKHHDNKHYKNYDNQIDNKNDDETKESQPW